ncbi:unnamed protein product, partial [Iphiclides podalirius]
MKPQIRSDVDLDASTRLSTSIQSVQRRCVHSYRYRTVARELRGSPTHDLHTVPSISHSCTICAGQPYARSPHVPIDITLLHKRCGAALRAISTPVDTCQSLISAGTARAVSNFHPARLAPVALHHQAIRREPCFIQWTLINRSPLLLMVVHIPGF